MTRRIVEAVSRDKTSIGAVVGRKGEDIRGAMAGEGGEAGPVLGVKAATPSEMVSIMISPLQELRDLNAE